MESLVRPVVPETVESLVRPAVLENVEKPVLRDQEESLVRPAVPENVEKPVLRELQDHKGRKVQLVLRDQEENPVHVGRQDLLVIRKIVYLHHF